MKVLVIGLGSMGQRRIRLLKQIDKNIELIGLDNNLERGKSVQGKYGIKLVHSIEEGLTEHIDCALICTSPLSHASLLKKLIHYDIFLFTELNLIKDGYELFQKYEEKLFLSSTLLYRKDIQHIIDKCRHQPVNYIYHVGQYLPDWHPWESYKDYFVGNQKTNGCRELFAIDLPWIIAAFGNIKHMLVKKGKNSSLEINYSDNYLIIFEHENNTKGIVALDVIARKAIRRLEVYSENIHLFWEGTPDSIRELDILNNCFKTASFYETVDKNENYSENIIENAYQDELTAVINLVTKGDRSLIRYDLEKDDYILSLIDKIEEA